MFPVWVCWLGVSLSPLLLAGSAADVSLPRCSQRVEEQLKGSDTYLRPTEHFLFARVRCCGTNLELLPERRAHVIEGLAVPRPRMSQDRGIGRGCCLSRRTGSSVRTPWENSSREWFALEQGILTANPLKAARAHPEKRNGLAVTGESRFSVGRAKVWT